MELYTKAIILEIYTNYAVVLTESGEVRRIHKKKEMLVSDQIYFLEEDLYTGNTRRRSIGFMQYAAAAAVFLLLFTGVFTAILQNKTYAAFAVGNNSVAIEVEFREDGKIKSIIDPTGMISTQEWRGKTWEELFPTIEKQVEGMEGKEILLSSTFPAKDVDKLKIILANLQRNSSKLGILYFQGSPDDLNESRRSKTSLNQFLLNHSGLNLWSDEESLSMSPEEKREYLGTKASYYQTNSDATRREELRQQEEQQKLEEEKRKAEEQKAEEERQQVQPIQRQRQQPQPIRRPTPRPQPTPRPVQNNDDWDDDDWDDADDDDDD